MAKPIKTFRVRSVSASVFENSTFADGQEVRFYKVNLQRTFKQGDEFKHNACFGRDEIPLARLVLERAWEYVLSIESAQSPSDGS